MGCPQQSSKLLSRIIQIGHMTVTLIIADLLFQALSATPRILGPPRGGESKGSPAQTLKESISRHSLAAIAGFNQELAQLSQGAPTNETNRTPGQPQSTRYFVIWHGRIFKEEQTHHLGVSLR